MKGDVNNDGSLRVSDLVAMQSFLLGKGSLEAPMNGDFCEDGVIDVFDLTAMRKYMLRMS